MAVPTNDELLAAVDSLILQMTSNGPLPDIRDEGRQYKLGEYLKTLLSTKRELTRRGITASALWLGQDDNLGSY